MRPAYLLSISIGVFLLLSTPRPIEAQWAPEPRFQSLSAPRASSIDLSLPRARIEAREPASTGKLTIAGVVGAAAGVVGGWKMRTALDGCHNDCAEIAVLGAALGSTLLTPLAVHLTDGRQGNFGYSILASAGIAVLGFGAVSLVAPDAGPLVWTTGVAIPLAQILSSVKIERMTAAANR